MFKALSRSWETPRSNFCQPLWKIAVKGFKGLRGEYGKRLGIKGLGFKGVWLKGSI